MARGLPSRALALAIVGLVFGAGLALWATPATAGTAVVFIEDFESGAIGSRWTATDNNAARGLDYWGISNYRAHAGNYSAWSAQVGTQAGTGQNNTAVHQYDNDMQADLAINLSVSGFTSLTLSFWYWSRAEAGGGDYLEAWFVAGGVPTMLFQNRGTASWTPWSGAVPSNVETLVIRFATDAANNNFEGAYVDDVVMTGTENNPPTSAASALPTYVNTTTVNVAFTAGDGVNESGVAYVELWYRAGTTGNFTLYTRPANPQGRWIAPPARFDVSYAAGDGYYEFYTIAVDNAANAEAPPASADASTTVDRTPPVLTITAPTGTGWTNASFVTARWQASDVLSGLDRYEVRIDGGPYVSAGPAATHDFTGLADDAHTIDVRAFDLAGNVVTASVTIRVDATAPAVQVTSPAGGTALGVATVTITWSASDAASGIDHYEVWLDDGAHETTTNLTWTLSNVPDGSHTFHVLAVDAAGNVREATVAFSVNTFPWWLVLLLLAIILILIILLVAWRRRKEEKGMLPVERNVGEEESAHDNEPEGLPPPAPPNP